MSSGAHRRRASRPALVLLQILVFVTYIFGPTAAFAEDPAPEPTPIESVAPEPSTEPSMDPTPAPSEPDPTPAPGTRPYLVTFAPGTDDARQLEILSSAGVTDESAIPQLRMRSVHLGEYADELAALNAFAEVARVDLDRTRAVEAAPSDTSYADQWSLPHVGWDQLYGSVGIAGTSTVAVLDTGVDASHPDLDGVVLPGTSVLDGSNGLSDPNGHGTWMAGIVAAETDNGTGIAGVAYAGVSVLPVTVLGADGTGQDSDIIAGVVYAADAGADVILMSFSNPGYSPALQAAIDYAWASGAVLVAATGNDGSGTATFPAATAGSSASHRRIRSTPWPQVRTTVPPPSWRPRASASPPPRPGGASRRSLAPRRPPPRLPAPRHCCRPTSPPCPTASSSRAWRAAPIRPATRLRPATAASTWPAPWPTPRPTPSSLPAPPLSAMAGHWSVRTPPPPATGPWSSLARALAP
ncbi:MAG: S8 family serine peptidase [Chloroflexi bacterium]|nr:S8 family serine peptidase [Chloroflexota bacterium]